MTPLSSTDLESIKTRPTARDIAVDCFVNPLSYPQAQDHFIAQKVKIEYAIEEEHAIIESLLREVGRLNGIINSLNDSWTAKKFGELIEESQRYRTALEKISKNMDQLVECDQNSWTATGLINQINSDVKALLPR